MTQEIIHLAAGKPRDYHWEGRTICSGIGKTEVGELKLSKQGILGDEVANHEAHGGLDRVVCLYPFEHYTYWANVLQKSLPMPAFGENLTATGMTEGEVCIGDIFKIGDVLLQVSQGRVPCDKISHYNGEKDFLRKVFETSLTGCFFRVLEEGTIRKDSKITRIRKDPAGITVAFANRTLFHEKEKASIERILQVEALSWEWREKLSRLL